MIEPTVLESRQERALLVSVDTGDFDAAASLQELHELTRSAGAEPCIFRYAKEGEAGRGHLYWDGPAGGNPGILPQP